MDKQNMEGWGVIHTYTREQAIEDGQLLDVSETPEAKEAGFRVPVCITVGVHALVQVPESAQWLAGLQRSVMGYAVPGCSGFQAGRGEAPCAVRGDLPDRSAPVRHGHALALLLGI